MWYSAQTCNGNSKVLITKFTSILHHIKNEHQWQTEEGTMTCEHEEIPENIRRKKNGFTDNQNRIIFKKKYY